jgi:hypothetical protein
MAVLLAGCALITDFDDLRGGADVPPGTLEAGTDAFAGLESGVDASAAPYGNGDGHDGPRALLSGPEVLNRYGALFSDAAAGAMRLEMEQPAAFTVGMLVLVHRSAGLPFDPASIGLPSTDLFKTDIGMFTLRRIVAIDGRALVLDQPIVQAIPRAGTQVVSVPELTTLTISASAQVTALPWDGTVGGIVAFFATGAVTNDGAIVADKAGFRGASIFVDVLGMHTACTDLNSAANKGFAFKGEGT